MLALDLGKESQAALDPPTRAGPWFDAGRAQHYEAERFGDPRARLDAISSLTTGLEINPRQIGPRASLARALRQDGQLERALAEAERVLAEAAAADLKERTENEGAIRQARELRDELRPK
jgi:hypothetical protein